MPSPVRVTLADLVAPVPHLVLVDMSGESLGTPVTAAGEVNVSITFDEATSRLQVSSLALLLEGRDLDSQIIALSVNDR